MYTLLGLLPLVAFTVLWYRFEKRKDPDVHPVQASILGMFVAFATLALSVLLLGGIGLALYLGVIGWMVYRDVRATRMVEA